jgi:uncharacterized protein YecE (DUF72 family)
VATPFRIQPPESGCRIFVGTSGYSYTEWAEAGFYPAGTRTIDMVGIYARHFPVTELNYTWYQMPKAGAVERMCARAPAGFHFTAKLTRTLTHEVDPHGWRSEAARYRDGIAPLLQARRLEAVLVQLPPGFRRRPESRRYLAALLDELAGLPVAVEFRHASWASDRVFAELARRSVALVAVDTPALPELFPSTDIVTHPDFFYVRFHGRNARGWRSGNMQKQFDYSYTEAELGDWVEKRIGKMAASARRGLIFFNNHVRAQAPRNAQMLMELLASKGMMEAPGELSERKGPAAGR